MVSVVACQPSEIHGEESSRRAHRAAGKIHRRKHSRCFGVSANITLGRGKVAAFSHEVAHEMKPEREIFPLAAALILPLAFCVSASAQGLDPAALLNPTSDSWPLYHGDYSGQRHSHLNQITPANVGELTLAWAFQTGQAAQIKSSPIVANGVLYVSVPDHVWA